VFLYKNQNTPLWLSSFSEFVKLILVAGVDAYTLGMVLFYETSGIFCTHRLVCFILFKRKKQKLWMV